MAKNCPKMATFGYIGHKRVLDAPNGWNEVEQGWNKWGDIWAGGLGPFFRSEIAISGLRGGWKWPKMCFVAISSSGGPKWVEQSGTRVEQVRGHMKNMFMFPHHSDQMSQRWKVSKIALWRCSLNVFVIVFVFVFVFVVVFWLVRLYFPISLIKCLKGEKFQRSLF